jgi:hypothetical protein
MKGYNSTAEEMAEALVAVRALSRIATRAPITISCDGMCWHATVPSQEIEASGHAELSQALVDVLEVVDPFSGDRKSQESPEESEPAKGGLQTQKLRAEVYQEGKWWKVRLHSTADAPFATVIQSEIAHPTEEAAKEHARKLEDRLVLV